MFYTIYKITNLINDKIYIGKHQTKDLNDNYMGSGKHLKYSIEKYGVENYIKEILFVFDNEEEMNLKEAELVSEEFCIREDTYNICPGGHGGWGYVNQNNLHYYGGRFELDCSKLILARKKFSFLISTDEFFKMNFCKRVSDGLKNRYANIPHHWFGKEHTNETKSKIGLSNTISQSGNKNSQFGTMWITNGKENKKIKKDENIQEGWYKGRRIKDTD